VIELLSLDAGSLHLLDSLERTPNPPEWLAEVEEFALGTGIAQVILSRAGVASLVVTGELAIGVTLHRPHPNFSGVELISVLWLDHRFRGRGLGQQAFDAVIEDARASARSNVLWLVHEANGLMLRLSRSVEGCDEYLDGDYVVFVA